MTQHPTVKAFDADAIHGGNFAPAWVSFSTLQRSLSRVGCLISFTWALAGLQLGQGRPEGSNPRCRRRALRRISRTAFSVDAFCFMVPFSFRSPKPSLRSSAQSVQTWLTGSSGQTTRNYVWGLLVGDFALNVPKCSIPRGG